MQKQNSQKDLLTKGVERVARMLTPEDNIVSVILEDHKPLKELISVMKDSSKEFEERVQAFKEFAPLLVTHAKAEEKALYEAMKGFAELKEMAFEGDVEHSLADLMAESIERTESQDEMSAKIKVIAELVEHHIKEEERDILPEVKKVMPEETLRKLTDTYTKAQEELIALGQDDSPSEADLDEKSLH